MSKPNFLYFMDGFNKQLEQQWEISISSYGQDKYGELLSIFDEDNNGKLSNTESQSLWGMVEEAAKEMGDPDSLETEEADMLVAKKGWNITGEDLIGFLAKLRGNVVWALNGGDTQQIEDTKDSNKVMTPEKIANQLHSSLENGKTKINLLCESIKQINPKNVESILDAYCKGDDENPSLIFDIMNADGIDPSTKKRCILYIFRQVLAEAKQKGVYINELEVKFNAELVDQTANWHEMDASYLDVFMNQLRARIESGRPDEEYMIPYDGKVDDDFYQGNTGDCWLISSINALRRTPKGRKILNDSIKKNSDGSFDVTLKGPKKTYHISEAELYGNSQLGTGEVGIRLLEIAVEKFFEEERGSSTTKYQLDINGNWEDVAFDILTGQGRSKDSKTYEHNPTDKNINNINKLNVVTTVSINNFANELLAEDEKGDMVSSFACKTTNGESVVIYTCHSYAVSRADGKNVYLINPWDSSTEIIISKEDFKQLFDQIFQLELT